MSGAADFESLLREAFAPVEPPEDLSQRLETSLHRLNQMAVDELEKWELESLADPRNWTRIARPIAAGVVATGAGAGLILLARSRTAKKTAVERLLKR